VRDHFGAIRIGGFQTQGSFRIVARPPALSPIARAARGSPEIAIGRPGIYLKQRRTTPGGKKSTGLERPPWSQGGILRGNFVHDGKRRESFIVERRPMARIIVEPAARGNDLSDSFVKALRLLSESASSRSQVPS
jgi:hypothetical protein